jgi:hypothetical protein
MIKGITLPSSELVAPDARLIFSVSPISVSPDGQRAVVDVLYSNDSGQLHAFMLLDLTDGTYLNNYNKIVGQGDVTSIKASSASVAWGADLTPSVVLGYEDLSDPATIGKDNLIGFVTGTTLNEVDLIETATNTVSNGSIQNLLIESSGRYVAFETAATNLSPPGALDTNGLSDVYLLDTSTDTLTRISVLGDGTDAQADDCQLQSIAIVDGKVSVLFSTTAAQIFSADDTNTDPDLYLSRDGEIILVSSNSANIASGYDGGYAGFVDDEIALVATDLTNADTDGLLDLYLVDVISSAKRVDPVVDSLNFSSDYDIWLEGNNNSEIILGFKSVNQNSTDLSNQLLGVEVKENTSEIYTFNSSGTLANDISDTPAISEAGNTIAFRTSATNLAAQDSLAVIVNHENTEPQGELALLGSVRVGQIVTVNLESFDDIDGFGSGLTYNWYLDGQIQNSSNNNSFTLTEPMLGKSLQVMVEYIDNWGVSENISLANTIVVANRGIELKLDGKTLNKGTIEVEIDSVITQISSNSSYFDLQGTSIGTVKLDSEMHTSDIDIGDVISSLRHIIGLDTLTGRAALAADVNNDSNVEIGDVISQLRHIVGLEKINKFDVVNAEGVEIGNSLTSQKSIMLLLNGDVDLSTTLQPSFYDV